MRNNKSYRHKGFLILGAAILAAVWMVGGPGILNNFNWHSKAIDIATLIPAMMVFFWAISGNKKFLACERKAFKKMLGLS